MSLDDFFNLTLRAHHPQPQTIGASQTKADVVAFLAHVVFQWERLAARYSISCTRYNSFCNAAENSFRRKLAIVNPEQVGSELLIKELGSKLLIKDLRSKLLIKICFNGNVFWKVLW